MMDLLILNGDRSFGRPHAVGYRGTCRAHPFHLDELPDDHQANQAFFWFLEEGGEAGVVHNLSRARWLAKAYRCVNQAYSFEVVEAVAPSKSSSTGGQFLGFDLSAGLNYSLLWWGLHISGPHAPGRARTPIDALAELIEVHFQPRLNANVLFHDLDDAQRCCDSMLALQALKPNLFENPEHSAFSPVALYLAG